MEYHTYSNSTDFPGICEVCAWINPQMVVTLECGHTMLDHAHSQLMLCKLRLKSAKEMDDKQFQKMVNLAEILYESQGSLIRYLLDLD